MKYKDFEDYLMEKYIKQENPLDDQIPDGFNDWIQELDIDLLIAYGEQYKNICVNETIEKLGGM